MVDDGLQILSQLDHQIGVGILYIHSVDDVFVAHLLHASLSCRFRIVGILFLLAISIAEPFHSILRRLLIFGC